MADAPLHPGGGGVELGGDLGIEAEGDVVDVAAVIYAQHHRLHREGVSQQMIRRADVQQNLPGQILRIQTVDPGLVQQNQQLPAQPFLLGGGFRGAQPHEGVYLHFQITHILFLLKMIPVLLDGLCANLGEIRRRIFHKIKQDSVDFSILPCYNIPVQ